VIIEWDCLKELWINMHPLKRNESGRTIPYMTPEWKHAIRNKRKFAVQFAKDRSLGNFELKRK